MSKMDLYTSPSLGKLSLDQVVNQIVDYLYEDIESRYRVVIGTDSQDRFIDGKKIGNFVTAIVVHRIGRGGRYFWKNSKYEHIHSLHQKIYTETLQSIAIAQDFVPKLTNKLNGYKNWELEIHIDVGRAGETRDMIKEVVGMVMGNGYTAKTKPEAFGASTIADKHT